MGFNPKCVLTDWYLLDWNDFRSLFDLDMLQKILNDYEEWWPEQWGVMLDGVRCTTLQTIGGGQVAQIDPTALLQVAIRERGSIPYKMWGPRMTSPGALDRNPTYQYWLTNAPWNIHSPPTYWYSEPMTYLTNRRVPFIIERGATIYMGPTDQLPLSGSFGEVTSIQRKKIMGSWCDPENRDAPKTVQEWSDMVKNTKLGDIPWDPPDCVSGGVGFQATNTGVKYYQRQCGASSGVGNNATTDFLDRIRGMMPKNAHKSTDPYNPGGSVEDVSIGFNFHEAIPNKKMYKDFADNQGGSTDNLQPILVFVPTPTDCSTHTPRLINSCAAKEVPPQILVRMKPVVANSTSLLTQFCTFNMKVHVKYGAKRRQHNWSAVAPEFYTSAQDMVSSNYWDWNADGPPTIFNTVGDPRDIVDTGPIMPLF